MKRKSIAILLIVTIILGIFLPISTVKAKDISVKEFVKELTKENSGNDLEIEEGTGREYTPEYLEYLALTEEEKAKVEVIPRKYKVPFETIYEYNNLGMLGSSDGVSEESTIPAEFDLRDVINVPVRDQGFYGNCWNFASIKPLETYLALNGYGYYDLSELHLDYIESTEIAGYRELHDGGDFHIFADYVSSFYGPVLEKEVPYSANYTTDDYEYLLNLESKIYVNETIDFPYVDKKRNPPTNEELTFFRNKIKEHIMSNGALYCIIATPDSGTDYFNTETHAEYFNASSTYQSADRRIHAVTIIGWDDNYSKDNFKEGAQPQNNGAYIAMNSWGESWGNNGCFYISYEDLNVESSMSGIVTASTKDTVLEKIEFEDVNLYNAMKDLLGKKVYNYNDANLTLTVSKLSLKDIDELDLQNKNIENLKGLEKFYGYVETINLSNNKIIDISPLSEIEEIRELNLSGNLITDTEQFKNLNTVYSVDLSNNNIVDVSGLNSVNNLYTINLSGNTNLTNIESLTQANYLMLNNCNLNDDIIEKLAELAKNNLSTVELKNNNITDVSGFIDTNLYSLDISGNTNIQLNTIPPYIRELGLSGCNVTDLDFISSYVSAIDLSNNPISDISELTNVETLDISGNENVVGIENLVQLTYLKMNDCNITDVTNLTNLVNLFVLELDNNNIVDIAPLINIDSLYDLSVNNNKIEKIEGIDGFSELSAANNNITYVDLRGFKSYVGINLENNNIETVLPLKYYTTNDECNIKNQTITKDINIKKDAETKFDIPEIILSAYENRFKDNNTITATNCTLDYENKKIIINTANNENTLATITINGGMFDGSVYTINYTEVDNVSVTGIEVTGSKHVFNEGSDFDKTKITVEIVYENGTKEEITDYDAVQVLNGTSLTKDQTSVTIKYGDFEEEYEISVFEADKIVELNFNDINMYKSILTEIKEYGFGENIIESSEYEKSIVVGKEVIDGMEGLYLTEVTDLTGISGFQNLKYLTFYKSNLTNVEELVELPLLEDLSIDDDNSLKDISCLKDNANLDYLSLWGTKLEDTGEVIQNINQLNIKNEYEESELNLIENKITLPDYINEIAKKDGGTQDLEAYICYGFSEKDDLDDSNKVSVNFVEDASGNLQIELDKEVTEEKIAGKRAIYIKAGVGSIANGSTIKIYYNTDVVLDSIEITSNPTKTTYIEGEDFDKSGLEVKKVYSDGTKEEITNYTITPETKLNVTDNEVIVSYTEGGITKTASIAITVELRQLSSIEITSNPSKTSYNVGESFDPTGLEVKKVYTNGIKEVITNYTLTPSTALTATDNTITVSYTEDGITKEATISITMLSKKLDSIEIASGSSKTTYIEGEDFDKTGLVVKKVYSDGTKEEITNYTIAPETNLSLTNNTITVSYTEDGITKEATITITVSAKKLDKIEITSNPSKTAYKEGETFDATGLVVTKTYDNGKSEVTTDYTITPNTALTTTDNTITISYTEGGITKEATITITVETRNCIYEVSDKYVSKVVPGTTIKEFKKNLDAVGNVNITDEQGNELTDEDYVVVTGTNVKVGDKDYKIVVTGDLDGDGEITITDLVKFRLFSVNKKTPTEMERKACDMDYEGIAITINDLVIFNLVSIGMKTL